MAIPGSAIDNESATKTEVEIKWKIKQELQLTIWMEYGIQ